MQTNRTLNFWKGKRVLVTGGYGFVASQLSNQLVEHNAVVVTTLRHRWPLAFAGPLNRHLDRLDLEASDLLDLAEVQQIFSRHQIDTIFHLAASAIVSDAANAPWSTAYNNVVSTLNILEAARIKGIPRVIVASSDKAYGDHADQQDPEPLPYRENVSLRGLDVYSSSKVCTDMLAQTYAYQFKLPVVVTRCCNIYGPGDLNFTRLIPRTILRLLDQGKPLVHQGNEDVLREYIHVDDVVRAYMLLGENVERIATEHVPKHGRATYGWCVYNVGSYRKTDFALGTEKLPNIRSVVDVIKLICAGLHKPADSDIRRKDREEFIEIRDQYLDATKIMELGFAPTIELEKGMVETCRWYSNHWDFLRPLAMKYIA